MVSTLVWMKWPTNVGYAIATLEQAFFDTARALADDDVGRVHFAYPSLAGGAPRSLPAGFTNVGVLDPTDATLDPAHVTRYVRERGIDVVIAFDLQPVHFAFGPMRRGGVRAIVCYWGAPISSPMPWWRLALKRAELRLARDKADGLLFESQAMADLAVSGRGVPPDMIDVVPLGVDSEAIKPAASTYVHDTLGIPHHQRVFVFSGHCTPRKGIATLVDAAVEVLVRRGRTDCCFLICGNQPGEERSYEERYRGLGVDGRIRFAGYRDDLMAIFQSAYCGVIPSTGWDSFTQSAVEMAATGLPVLASRLQGLAEAVRHEETGLLFEPGNVRELADAVERLLDDPALAQRYGRQGRGRVERDLTKDLQRQRLLAAVSKRIQPTRTI